MDKDSLKIAVDIAKTKLAFFSAVAGGIWFKIDLSLDVVNVIMVLAFVASVGGVFKNLLLLGRYERMLRDE
jgi:multisubunit Na+/H+ antiporter MnhF subunit